MRRRSHRDSGRKTFLRQAPVWLARMRRAHRTSKGRRDNARENRPHGKRCPSGCCRRSLAWRASADLPRSRSRRRRACPERYRGPMCMQSRTLQRPAREADSRAGRTDTDRGRRVATHAADLRHPGGRNRRLRAKTVDRGYDEIAAVWPERFPTALRDQPHRDTGIPYRRLQSFPPRNLLSPDDAAISSFVSLSFLQTSRTAAVHAALRTTQTVEVMLGDIRSGQACGISQLG